MSEQRLLLATLDSLSEAEWSQPQPRELKTYQTVYHCAWSALEHYLDHAAVLRAELGLAMPKRLLHFK